MLCELHFHLTDEKKGLYFGLHNIYLRDFVVQGWISFHSLMESATLTDASYGIFVAFDGIFVKCSFGMKASVLIQ